MDPYVLLRNGNVTGNFWTQPVSFAGNHVVSLMVVVLTNTTMTVDLEWSNDLMNWTGVHTWPSVGFGSNALGPVTDLVAGYIRAKLTPNDIPPNIIVLTVTLLLYPADQHNASSLPTPTVPAMR